MSFWSFLGLASASDIQALHQELQNTQITNSQLHTQQIDTIQAIAEAVADVSREVCQINASLNTMPGTIQTYQKETRNEILQQQSDLAGQMSALHQQISETENLMRSNMGMLLHTLEVYQQKAMEKTSELQTQLVALETMSQHMLAELKQKSEAYDCMREVQEKILASQKDAMSSQKQAYSSLEETQRLIANALNTMKDYLNLLLETSKLAWVEELLDSLEDCGIR